MKNPWDIVYEESSIEELGWYEKESQPSLSLIEKHSQNKDNLILDAGCGETTLIQELINKNYTNIYGIDLSSVAINFLKNNVKTPNNFKLSLEVKNLTDDLSFSTKGNLWHDRAVFHFLHSDKDRETYKKNILNFLEDKGILILSCFSKENSAERCNNLLVKKYDEKELISFFSDSFTLLENFSYDYTMPWGDNRKFLYFVFQKNS